MPWQPSDAPKYTHKANTPEKQRQWAEVANKALSEDYSDSAAIRIANASIAETPRRHGRHTVI